MISIVILNYKRSLFPVLESIKRNTKNKYEIIVVDNGNSYPLMASQYIDKYIGLKKNEGVLARNYGKLIAKYDYIACIDDDVTVVEGWDEVLLTFLEGDSKVVGVGPCGHYIFPDLSNYNARGGIPGNYVDVLTGYCWMHKNIKEGLLPWNWGVSSWHDETYIQLQMRERGCTFKMTPNVCTHNSQRGEISDESWKDHNDKIERIKNRFKFLNLYLEDY